jgi:UDP-N-acetylglucosamine 2-epimerase (hydrolysing)
MKKIVFLTGTRADFGKIKPLIRAVDDSPDFDYTIFVTGMHLLFRYGLTVDEVHKAGFKNIYTFMNQIHGEPMEMVLANTIQGLSRYVHEFVPDMLVVHGDRVEALAGAIVGALRNILVGHIEGGEISGTVDDLIRHSVTKLSHLHFSANKSAEERLRQLGEHPQSIYTIGSPDIDVMLSNSLPSLNIVKQKYGIRFNTYSVVLYHPVTTELDKQRKNADELVSALLSSGKNYVVIHPNNDTGCDDIFDAYLRLENNSQIRELPSMRFEYFLALLKYASFIIGNSSAGIREAPVFAVPTINIGTRQQNRFSCESIIDIDPHVISILNAIKHVESMKVLQSSYHFGNGNSAVKFIKALNEKKIWDTPKQKQFLDMPYDISGKI